MTEALAECGSCFRRRFSRARRGGHAGAGWRRACRARGGRGIPARWSREWGSRAASRRHRAAVRAPPRARPGLPCRRRTARASPQQERVAALLSTGCGLLFEIPVLTLRHPHLHQVQRVHGQPQVLRLGREDLGGCRWPRRPHRARGTTPGCGPTGRGRGGRSRAGPRRGTAPSAPSARARCHRRAPGRPPAPPPPPGPPA